MPDPVSRHPLLDFVERFERWVGGPHAPLPTTPAEAFRKETRRLPPHLSGLPRTGWWLREREIRFALDLWRNRLTELERVLMGIAPTITYQPQAQGLFFVLRRSWSQANAITSLIDHAAVATPAREGLRVPGVSYAIQCPRRDIPARLKIIPFGLEIEEMLRRLGLFQAAVGEALEKAATTGGRQGTARLVTLFGPISLLGLSLFVFYERRGLNLPDDRTG